MKELSTMGADVAPLGFASAPAAQATLSEEEPRPLAPKSPLPHISPVVARIWTDDRAELTNR